MAPLKGSSLCFAHSPSTAAKRRAASAKGGKRTRIGYGVPADVSSASALQAHLAQVLGDTLRRPNTERRAVTVARLLDVGRKLLDDLDVRRRLDALEDRFRAMEAMQ